MDISSSVANDDRQANFERDFEEKSLYYTAVITNPKSKKGAPIMINSGSEVRVHLAAIGCNGQEILMG